MMIRKDKIIVVYASCGQGHKKAAEAIAEYFSFPCLDILDFTHPLLKLLFSDGYRFISKRMGWLWSIIYHVSKITAFRPLFSPVFAFVFAPFVNFIREKKTACIITTHFFLIDIVPYIRRYVYTRVATVVTDVGVHPLWVSPYVDKYFVADEESRRELAARGISEEYIEVAGFPLRKGFRQKLKREQIKRRFFPDDKPVLLVFSSREGRIPYLDSMIKHLLDDFNLLVIYGDNFEAKALLDGVSPASVKGFPYYENIWELMEIADVLVTKPGGLTVFEALCKRKPLIFTHFIPGQEERNMEFVVKKGWGFYVSSFGQLRDVVNGLVHGYGAGKHELPDLCGDKFFRCMMEFINERNRDGS